MKKNFLALGIAFLAAAAIFAQSANSNYIHQFMLQNQSCKGGAITDNQGYVLLCGRDGYSWSGIPTSLHNYLNGEFAAGRIVDDVCITEGGKWYAVGTKLTGNGAPQSLYNKVNEFLNYGDRILGVTFNDKNEWIVISDGHFTASDDSIMSLMRETYNQYGSISAAWLTNSGLIIVADSGIKWRGNVPQKLVDYLRYSRTFHIANIKFTESGSCLVTDGNHYYWYDLY